MQPLSESMKYLQSMQLIMTTVMFAMRIKDDAENPKPVLRPALSLKNDTIKSNQCDSVNTTV